ncbi:MAG: hypothetical protein EPO06_02220 [Burkholderiaceae bacterium]|nr:MAG: hypothetical protein EPO06_02220 [Burkholderiaceae bacterium]
MFRKTLFTAACTLPLFAHAANFTGAWQAKDHVCKFACTTEDPNPDFEIRIGIILIQRGSLICGLRFQNTLADKSTTIPLRGLLKGTYVELESGEALYNDEPVFPFVVENRTRLLRKGHILVEASSTGNQFAKYQPKPFSPVETRQYVEANNTYFEACFASKSDAKP